jgi:hypothetical protein
MHEQEQKENSPRKGTPQKPSLGGKGRGSKILSKEGREFLIPWGKEFLENRGPEKREPKFGMHNLALGAILLWCFAIFQRNLKMKNQYILNIGPNILTARLLALY